MNDKRHKALWKACRTLPEDYKPWGEVFRWEDPSLFYPDCSTGCRYFAPLHDGQDEDGWADPDWGVCTNPKSHRCGLLTYEHQGCTKGK